LPRFYVFSVINVNLNSTCYLYTVVPERVTGRTSRARQRRCSCVGLSIPWQRTTTRRRWDRWSPCRSGRRSRYAAADGEMSADEWWGRETIPPLFHQTNHCCRTANHLRAAYDYDSTLRFYDRSTARQRSIRSQWRNTSVAADPLTAVTLTYIYLGLSSAADTQVGIRS